MTHWSKKFRKLVVCLNEGRDPSQLQPTYLPATIKEVPAIVSITKRVLTRALKVHPSNLALKSLLGDMKMNPFIENMVAENLEIIDFLIDSGALIPTSEAVEFIAIKLTIGSISTFIMGDSILAEKTELRVAERYRGQLTFVLDETKSRLEKLNDVELFRSRTISELNRKISWMDATGKHSLLTSE